MTKKRFIAAAVCPSCQSMDTLYVYHVEQIEHVACVNCHYHAQQSGDDGATQAADPAAKSTSDVIPISFKA